MVSYYLRREVRDRMVIARDLALLDDRDWDTIGNISSGLEVMFAVTGENAETGEPEFKYLSTSSWNLTGYWPNELLHQNPKVLQGPDTDGERAHAFMSELMASGTAETKLINIRKNGDAYGCHIMACEAPPSATGKTRQFYAFFSECSIKECEDELSVTPNTSRSDDQIETC